MAKIMIEYQDQEGSLRRISPLDLHNKAVQAGQEAADECEPTPMDVIGHSTGKRYRVSSGVCGFASVHVYFKDTMSRRFLNGLIKAKVATRDVNAHGYSWNKSSSGRGFYYWVSLYTQSMDIKEAFAGAMVKVLQDHGVGAHARSRMD